MCEADLERVFFPIGEAVHGVAAGMVVWKAFGQDDAAASEIGAKALESRAIVDVLPVVLHAEWPSGEAMPGKIGAAERKPVEDVLPGSGMDLGARRQNAVEVENAASHGRRKPQKSIRGARFLERVAKSDVLVMRDLIKELLDLAAAGGRDGARTHRARLERSARSCGRRRVS